MFSILNELETVVWEIKNKELHGAESERKGTFQRFNKPVKCRQLTKADGK